MLLIIEPFYLTFFYQHIPIDLLTSLTSYTKIIIYTANKNIITQKSSILTQMWIEYLKTLLTSIWMTASPEKSSITLIATNSYQSSLSTQIKLNMSLILLNKLQKSLVLYSIRFTFSTQTRITSANRKLNILLMLSQNEFDELPITLSIA